MERVQPGMEVYSSTTRLGTVAGVEHDARSDRPALVIRRDGGLLQAAAEATYELRGGVVRVDEALLQAVIDAASARERTTPQHSAVSQTHEPVAGDAASSEALRIPIMQDAVIVGKRSVERGGVRVHKRVHERERWLSSRHGMKRSRSSALRSGSSSMSFLSRARKATR